eukprot:scaffold11153_cov85-Cylindrotheca_fusiformis.AAC.1
MALSQVTDQDIQDGAGQKGSYTGQINAESRLPQGTGTMTYYNNNDKDDDHDSQNSNMNEKTSSSSSTIITKARKYEGEWQDGYWHGHGTCELQNGDIYQGGFVNHERHGNGGQYTWAIKVITQGNEPQQQQQQRIYQGTFCHNQLHGRGFYMWKTFLDNNHESITTTYTGMFDNGEQTGHGVYESPTVYYVGDWERGVYHGYGILKTTTTTTTTDEEGKIYRGYFRHGQKHGKGVERLTRDNSIIHRGKWRKDQPVMKSRSKRKTSVAPTDPPP